MKIIHWWGRLSPPEQLEVLHLDVGKWFIEITLFNFYYGIEIINDKVKIMGRLK